jgi:hypothetical protein
VIVVHVLYSVAILIPVISSNPNIEPPFVITICGATLQVAVNQITVHWGISVYRLSWALSKGDAIMGCDSNYI